MKIKVLALFGSPRRGGNSDTLMEELLSGVSRDGGVSITRLYLSEMNILPCAGCGTCEKTGACRIQDDMQDIYPLLEDTQVVVLSSPVYFFGLSSQCKVMIDRTHMFWARKHVLNRSWSLDDEIIRQGFFISTAGTDKQDLFIAGETIVKNFFECMEAVYQGSLTVEKVQESGSIKKKTWALKEAYNKGVELMNPY
jgi:multimeric flavodoxin WrbA